MTAPSHLNLAGEPVNRRRLRRLSRQFAAVGVDLPVSRLREIAAGRPAGDGELVNIAFAEAALRIKTEQRHAKRVRAQRRCVHSLIVAVAVVLALSFLLCLGLAFFMLAEHMSPF